MEVRLFKKDKDYPIVLEWWNKYQQTPAPIEFLSDWGVIVSENGKPICAIWFYPIVSVKFGLIKSPIANPDTTKEERNMALNLCLNTIHEIAKDLGYTHVLCPSNVEAFKTRLTSIGYVAGDENCTHFWGGL